MFPINKEFITSEELRAQAASLERSAAKRAHARRIEAEACREDAAFLDAYRADVGITRAADALQAA